MNKILSLALAVFLCLGAHAQFLPPSIGMPGGVSPRANQMKHDARNVSNPPRAPHQTKSGAKPQAPQSHLGASTSTQTAPTVLSAVHRAAADGKIDVLKSELTKDPTAIARRDTRGYTPLHYAAQGGHIEVLRELIKEGANLNMANTAGETPVYLAVTSGRTETALDLLKAGADPNLVTRDASSPLQKAAQKGDLTMVNALLAAGADPLFKDKRGQTALDLAQRYSSSPDTTQVITALIKASGQHQ